MLQVHQDIPAVRSTRADIHTQAETVEAEACLRQELECARQALRLQTARARHGDRRLAQREREAQWWRTLRERQLGDVMRALMVLEARLRREQRTIRSQLGERDAVIRAQQLEIQRLRKLLDSHAQQEEVKSSSLVSGEVTSSSPLFEYDCDVKPDLISSLGVSHLHLRRGVKSLTPTSDNEDCQSNLDSLQLSFYEIGSQPESLASNLSTQSCNGEDISDHPTISPPKTFQEPAREIDSGWPLNNNNYSIDLKLARSQELSNGMKKLEINVHSETQYLPHKNILSPVKEESSVILSACSSPARCNPCEEQTSKDSTSIQDKSFQECKPTPSSLLQELRISGRNEYENNPVLNCVNQILLRDQEEFLEEQRAMRLKEQEKAKKEAVALNNKKLTKSTENLSLLNEQIIVQHSPVKSKVYPPLTNESPPHLPEPIVLNRSIQDAISVEEDHYKTINKLQSPIKVLTPPKEISKTKVSPPALPPKPLRLAQSKPKTVDQKSLLSNILPHIKGDDTNAIEIINNSVPLSQPSADSELYVISNSAIDDELLQKIQGRRINPSDLTPNSNKALSHNQMRETLYPTIVSHPTHKPPAKASTISPQKNNSVTQKPSPKKFSSKEEDINKTPKHSPLKAKMSPSSCIKVASPVSSLLNSVDVGEPAKEDSSGKKTSPSVSQMVRKFEVLTTQQEPPKAEENSNNLQKNFEEFRLDDMDREGLEETESEGDGRLEGDGAEARLNGTAAETKSLVSYENFLEATGLSQKSIMTPSRLFSNHKSMMKPKDVKHRSRVKAAATDRCNNAAASAGPVVRYWTEPFL